MVIRVLDSNDNAPEFTRGHFRANVSENAAIGSDVIHISAVDRDKNSRLFFTILATANSVSDNKFEINSETGKFNFVIVIGMTKIESFNDVTNTISVVIVSVATSRSLWWKFSV